MIEAGKSEETVSGSRFTISGLWNSFRISSFGYRVFLLSASALLVVDQRAPAFEAIKPPFGLAWGEKEERMETLLKAAKATIVQRRKIEGREAWDVEGLKNGLKRAVFFFRTGALVEVELQYQKDDWDQAKYDSFMEELRVWLEKKFGTGQLIADKTEPAGETVQRAVKWKWNQNGASVELNFFSAKQDALIFRTLSVHYRAE
jgi:hypothetical protein